MIGVALIAVVMLLFVGSIFETNTQGYYQVKQAFYSGKMSVRMTPGTYGQMFGTITTYKANATVGFGDQEGDISANLDSIPVVFNEGSYADIAGLIRLQLPNTEYQMEELLKEFAGGYDHFIEAGIVPIVENAVKLGANLRSAQDAYTTLALFQQSVQDQLQNGVYVTHSERKEITNATGDKEVRQVTVISLDSLGHPMRQPNRLQELGCKITSCVIDVPGFDKTVVGMIAKRKEEAMKTELAKQAALRAQQDAITAEEQGKADVAKKKYEKEVELVAATTKAREEFEVAEFEAKKALEVKKQLIATGQGEAEAAALKVRAGLTPQEKAEWNYKTQVGVAAEFAKAAPGAFVPNIMVIGGSGNGGGSTAMDAIGLNMLMEVQAKMNIKSTK